MEERRIFRPFPYEPAYIGDHHIVEHMNPELKRRKKQHDKEFNSEDSFFQYWIFSVPQGVIRCQDTSPWSEMFSLVLNTDLPTGLFDVGNARFLQILYM